MAAIDAERAMAHFNEVDPHMARMLHHALHAKHPIALPTPKPPTAYFETIVRSIVSQQISVAAAAAVFGRLLDHLGTITPKTVAAADEESLRTCGLSGQKVRYLKENADLWHTLPIEQFKTMSDAEVLAELTRLYGVGAWTAEMFLMFSLARPDIFSYGDLGLVQGLCSCYGYQKHWNRKIDATVTAWSPHRTIASLVLWHQKDNGPVEF